MSASVVCAPAWRGWVSKGDPCLTRHEAGTDTVQLDGVVFSLPDPEEAKTSTWVRDSGDFCVFSGYLYNHREMAADLRVREEGRLPADLALAGYRRWGATVLEKLEGSFACAFWDGSARRLVGGRDAIGLHPFFYSLTCEGLVFSWDLDTVLRHPAVSRELNRTVLAEHLTHHWWNPHETFFRAVCRLPAGHGLKFEAGRLELFRYWNPVPPGGPIRWTTRQELPEFPVLFRKAIEGAMECGNGRAGILLSGGLDSVSVAAEAQKIAQQNGWPPPHALSVIFPAEGSEEPMQRSVAQTLQLPQSFTRVEDYESGPGLLQGSLALSCAGPSPPTFVFAPPFQDLLKLAASKGCQVVLTGDGGDETLGVTPVYTADLIRSGDWLGVVRLFRTLGRYWPAPFGQGVRQILWTYGLRAVLRDWIWRQAPGLALRCRRQLVPRAIPDWVAPDPELRRELIERFEQHWDRQTNQHGFYVTFIDNWLRHPLPQMIFEEQFFRNAAAGIPTLHPYWHRPMVEFLLRTPPEILNSGDRWKSLARAGMVSRFPELGFDRQKKLIATDAPRQLLQREGPGLWQTLGPAKSMAALGLVHLERYHAMLQRSAESDRAMDLYNLWHGAGTEAWVRSHT